MELEAICHMVKFVERVSKQARHTNHDLFIFSSSQSTLKALAKPHHQTGQRLLEETIDAVQSLKRMGYQVSFHWIPSYSDALGNKAAHQQAIEATDKGFILPESETFRTSFPQDRIKTMEKWRKLLSKITTGKFTKAIDEALLQGHTRRLYNNLSQKEAAILAQLRTGQCISLRILHVWTTGNSKALSYRMLEVET